MAEFLVTQRILDKPDHRPLVRFCWCSDGPWDICDFVIKQCFISKVNWILNTSTPVLTCYHVLERWKSHRGFRISSLTSVLYFVAGIERNMQV